MLVFGPRSIARTLVIGLFVAVFLTVTLSRELVSDAAGTCGMQKNDQAVVFCDTFDAPAGTGNRAGDLNGTVWGVSRDTGNTNGFDAGAYDAWTPTRIQMCDGSSPLVAPPADVRICNGQLREAVNDNHTVAVLAMYPKQPFDFGGRTGTVSFDVSNDTNGTHAAWPEFWVTDQPIPAPFTHFASWQAAPRNGFGIRFGASDGAGCAGKWTVDSAVVSRNFAIDDSTEAGNSIIVTPLDCVTKGTFTALNHVEVRVSQSQLDVYATDAGSTALKHIAVVSNVNLTFTRGLVWIEDVHYNASKGPCCQTEHTFAWDNVAFDGPATYRDLSFDVLDSLVPAGGGNVNLGWRVSPGNSPTVATLPLPGSTVATGAMVMFNATVYNGPVALQFTLNGHPYTVPEPAGVFFGNHLTIAVPVNLADLVGGPNAIRLSAGQLVVVSNVNIVLVHAAEVPGGGGTSPSPTPTATPTSTPAAGSIQGSLRLEGRSTFAGIVVTASPGGVSVATNAAGGFTLTGLSPTGTYSLVASFPGFLSTRRVNVSGGGGTAPAGLLRGGDIDGDGKITIADVSAVAGAFGSTSPSLSDLNVNGIVDISDVSLVAANFGLVGPTAW